MLRKIIIFLVNVIFRKRSLEKQKPQEGDLLDDDIPRYPPFAKGLPIANTPRILSTQRELINRIKKTLRFNNEEFNRIVAPVIERYAAYVHLLPASEDHHHRGAGGLFRHGLEVGLWAAQRAGGKEFFIGDTPEDRSKNKPRWQFAAFLGGLLHDVGKPLSDVSVVNLDGSREWNPYDTSLSEWLDREKLDKYFLRWRSKRNKRHEKFSMMNLDQIITPCAKSYLNEPGPFIIEQLLESIVGTGASDGLSKLVLWADSESVRLDIQQQRLNLDEYAYGVPVERFVFDALRRIAPISKVNETGALIWRDEHSIFISWEGIVAEIHNLLQRDKTPGVPRNADSLADILIERGFAIPFTQPDTGKQARYWKVYPEPLNGIPQQCLRIDDTDLVFTNEPPSPVKISLKPPSPAQSHSTQEVVTEPVVQASAARPPETIENPNHKAEPEESPVVLTEALEAEYLQYALPTEQVSQSAASKNNTKRKKSAKEIKSEGDPAQPDESEALPKNECPVIRNNFPDSEEECKSKIGERTIALPIKPSKGKDLLELALRKRSEGILAIERLIDRSFGIPYPIGAQYLGEPRQVMNDLFEDGLLKIDPSSPNKTSIVGGKKYLIVNADVSKSIGAILEGNATEASVQTEEEEVRAKPKKANVNPEIIFNEFLTQCLRGFGNLIEGEVVEEHGETSLRYKIDKRSIKKIADFYSQSPATINLLLRKQAGISIDDKFICIDTSI